MISQSISRQHDVGGAMVQRHGRRFSVALKHVLKLNRGTGGSAPRRAGVGRGRARWHVPYPPAARSRANESVYGASRQKEHRG